MALDGRAAQQEINLIITVPEAPQVFNASEGGLAVGDGGVHVMLLALLVDAESFEGQVPAGAIVRFHGPGEEEWGLQVQLLDPLLHQAEFDRDDPGHLDGAAE